MVEKIRGHWVQKDFLEKRDAVRSKRVLSVFKLRL
jgi:hypothetical protein